MVFLKPILFSPSSETEVFLPSKSVPLRFFEDEGRQIAHHILTRAARPTTP